MLSRARFLPAIRVAAAPALAVAASLTGATSVHAYPPPPFPTATLTCTPSDVPSISTCTFTLTFAAPGPVGSFGAFPDPAAAPFSRERTAGVRPHYTVTGVRGASVRDVTPVNSRGVATASLVDSDGRDCQRMATVVATADGTGAQTTVPITCGGGVGTARAERLDNTLAPPVNTRHAVPAGRAVPVDCAASSGMGSLTSMLASGETLVDACQITSRRVATPTSPVTVALHSAAIRPGDRVYGLTDSGLRLYPNATVGQGEAIIPVTGDAHSFAVVAPTTSTPPRLADGGAGASSHSPRPTPIIAGVAVLIALIVQMAVVARWRRRAAH